MKYVLRLLVVCALVLTTLVSVQPAQAAAPDFTVKESKLCNLVPGYRDYTVSVTWRIRGSDGWAQPVAFNFSVRSSDSGDTLKVTELWAQVFYGGSGKERWSKPFDSGATSGAMSSTRDYGAVSKFRPRGTVQNVYVELNHQSRLCWASVPSA